MCDEWMPLLKLPLSIEEFHSLPQNPAYKYEYYGERAVLSPRPKHYNALLDLRPLDVSAPPPLRPITDDDFEPLTHLFSGAFSRQQPFACLTDEARLKAAHESLKHTWDGEDGPWLREASFVALDAEDGSRVGAIFITLLPPGEPEDWRSYQWHEPPPPDLIERRGGRPHQTWVFVHPWLAAQGIGTALLAASVNELLKRGYTQLFSTFLLGNHSSMLWHWRNGFRLLPYPFSVQRAVKEYR